MDGKLFARIGVKAFIGAWLIASAIGDVLSTRLTVEKDGKEIWEAATDEERARILDLGPPDA